MGRERKKILIAAGGTAGHLYPAQQLASLLESDCKILFAGHRLQESPYFQKEKFRFFEVVSAPFGRSFFGPLLRGLFQAIRLFRREKPDVVVGFGSYHTVPLLLGAVLFRKKIILYEPNLTLGKVNQLFAPFAKRIAVQFLSGSKKFTPVPLFPWIRSAPLGKSAAREAYGLDPSRKTILIFGGSQGAKFLNEVMPKVSHKAQVIHLTGREGEATAEHYAKAGIHAVVKPFESNMAQAYAAADLAICRSGAGTIAELIRYGVPSLLIPYPYAYGHQELNARYIETRGGGHLLLQSQATPEVIGELIAKLDLDAMRVALRSAEEQNKSLIGFDAWVRQC